MTQNITETNIIVNLQFAALHQWSSIPENHSQSYLKNLHRHVFHIQMKWPVYHDDRDKEFIELKNEVERYLKTRYPIKFPNLPNLGPKSCEMLAKELLIRFDANYVRVMEDGENGAEISKNSASAFFTSDTTQFTKMDFCKYGL